MRVSFKAVCFLLIFILAFSVLPEYSESQRIRCNFCSDECGIDIGYGNDYCLYGPDASGLNYWESDCIYQCPYDDEIGCDIGCGAECEVDDDCLDECASTFDRHTTCGNMDCNDCDCTGSEDCRTLCTSSTNRRTGCTDGSGCTGSEDCLDLCADGTHRYAGCTSGSGCTGSVDCQTLCADTCTEYSGCTSGSGCTDSVDCGPYTCVVGTGCTTTCSQECGAECEGDSDCSSDGCSGSCPGCTYLDYYCGSNCACDYISTDPDTSQNYCSVHCGQQWAVGGSGDCTGGSCLSGCCGDDSGEYYNYQRVHFDVNEIGFDNEPADDTCCEKIGRCVYDEECYINDSAYDLDGNGLKEAFCYRDGDWINTDYHSSYCTSGGYAWNVGGGDATGDNYAGTWGSTNTNYCHERQQTEGANFVASIHCCCGDDPGEYYRYCEGSSTFPDTGDCTSDDKACCNFADDCVTADGTTCVEKLTTSVDADGDGDNDYCNDGVWYECNTDLQCPVGYVCSSNDCVACTANDCLDHPNCWDGSAGCCDEDSDCTANDDDFCQYFNAGDENAKTNPAGDSDTEAGNIELASLHVCAPAKHLDRGTEASNTDGFCLNTKYSRTQTYQPGNTCPHSDSDRWKFVGDSMLTAQTSYTTSYTDLCFVYVYDPCEDSDGPIVYRNGAGTRGSLGTLDQGYDINSGCSQNWIWINFGPGNYGNTIGKDVLGSTNGLMKIATYSYGDYVREWQFGWRKGEAGSTDGSNSYWCCDASTDCVDDAPSQGNRVSGDPDSTNSGCYDTGTFHNTGGGDGSDTEECRSGTWYAQDDDQTACQNAGNYWSVGGDITDCCEDDLDENYLTVECDGHACDSDPGVDACCDDPIDCVWDDGCYVSGSGHPTIGGATCVDGVWRDLAPPETTINPDGVDYNNKNETSFNFTRTDAGGGVCDVTKYRIVDLSADDPEALCVDWDDLTEIYTPGAQIPLGCLFGSTCDFRVCFASNDSAGNEEAMNISGVFHLSTHVCQDRQCGQPCLFTQGVCNGSYGNCYADGGCLLNCSAPSPGNGNQRIWENSACSRSGVYKCDGDSVCNQSLTSCTTGGSPEQINGGWTSYDYPTGSYTIDDEFTINLSGLWSGPSGFTILAECRVNNSNNDAIYFNNWGSGDVSFNYTIKGDDPEGTWRVEYCKLWSGFSANGGWLLKRNDTLYEFMVDQTSPDLAIENPSPGWYNDDFDVNATASDESGVAYVGYRWENSTYTGAWNEMSLVAGVYTKVSDVNSIPDGNYTITVLARDNSGIESTDSVDGVSIDKISPVFEGYSVSGCNYQDIYSSTCWVKQGTTTNHEIQHNDSYSKPSIQYVTFTRGCNPDNCPAGDEIKSYVNFYPSWNSDDLLENDTALNIQTPTCTQAGGCSEETVKVNWPVLTGSEAVSHNVWTLLRDRAGNEEGYNDTGWQIISDNTPPVTNVKELPPYSGVIINLFWEEVQETGSGTDCYVVQYSYFDRGNNFYDWKNISFSDGDCTTQTPPHEFDLMDEFQLYDEEVLDDYVFYFRSLGKDKVGNLETKAPLVNDTNTTIFIPELVDLSAYNSETGRPVRNRGWFPRGKEITISARVKDDVDVMETVDVVINYSNHTRGGDPLWKSQECDNLQAGEECKVTIGPFETGEVAYYVQALASGGTRERNPPAGYMVFFVAEHPLCNFLTMDVMTAILGSSEFIPVEVRNIQDQSDIVGLNFSGSARFIETGSQYIEVPLNSMEEKIIYARIAPSSENFYIVLSGNSSIDSTLLDTDTIQVIVGYPADFPGLSDFGALILIMLAALVYLKLVRTEN